MIDNLIYITGKEIVNMLIFAHNFVFTIKCYFFFEMIRFFFRQITIFSSKKKKPDNLKKDIYICSRTEKSNQLIYY